MKLREIMSVPSQIYVIGCEGQYVPITMPYLGVTYDHVIRAIPEILDAEVDVNISTITKVFVKYRVKEQVSVRTTVSVTKLDGTEVDIVGRYNFI